MTTKLPIFSKCHLSVMINNDWPIRHHLNRWSFHEILLYLKNWDSSTYSNLKARHNSPQKPSISICQNQRAPLEVVKVGDQSQRRTPLIKSLLEDQKFYPSEKNNKRISSVGVSSLWWKIPLIWWTLQAHLNITGTFCIVKFGHGYMTSLDLYLAPICVPHALFRWHNAKEI